MEVNREVNLEAKSVATTTSTRTTWAELEAACGPIGGLMGIPQLITMVGALMPGGASLPPSWGTWLAERITERQDVTLSCETPTGVWRLEIR